MVEQADNLRYKNTPPLGICCYEIKAFAVIFHISLYSYSLAPEYKNSYEFREYSNCLRSKDIIASQLPVVLTEPPFRYGSFIIPATIMAIRTDQPSCFGYRSRSAVRSLILDEWYSQIRSWRHTTDLLQIAVLYLSTVYALFKDQWNRYFRFLLTSR